MNDMTNLAVRTKAAISAAPTAISHLLEEWLTSTDAKALGNMAQTRVQNYDLKLSQKRLAAAIDLAADLIRNEARLDVVIGNNPPQKDRRYVTLLEVFDKAIEGQVKV